jgi:hypothetical protein
MAELERRRAGELTGRHEHCRAVFLTPDVIGLCCVSTENSIAQTKTWRPEMTNLDTIAKNYIAAWNETDAARREALLEAAFAADISYRDPIMQGDGRDGVSALIGGVQQQFPGFRFALKGTPDGYADKIRFSWELGPEGAEAPIEGTDIGVIEEGRLKTVTGFLDKVPTA